MSSQLHWHHALAVVFSITAVVLAGMGKASVGELGSPCDFSSESEHQLSVPEDVRTAGVHRRKLYILLDLSSS